MISFMKISYIDGKINEIRADLEIVFLINKDFDHKWIKKQKSVLTKIGFKGEAEEKVFLQESGTVVAAAASAGAEDIRRAAAAAVKAIKGEYKTAKIGLYLDKTDKEGSVSAMCEGLLLGDYKFETYKSKKTEHRLEEILISRSEYSAKKIPPEEIKIAVQEAMFIAGAVNMVRDNINTPPEEATPQKVADLAAGISSNSGITCRVYDEAWIQSQGMGAFYAVGKASENPPRLIHLSYTPTQPRAKVALIGKGITYDTGGLSLKPASAMTTMKADKSGALTALGIILAASRLKMDVEIHALLGMAENMVSGSSYRPDDILKAKNGKTIEVKNTDAEGRLVLADCLCYAQELEPDYIIDMATLTESCVVGLGEYTFAVMGHDEKLKREMLAAAEQSGELAHSLPFNRHLKKLLKSEAADVPNIGSKKYGGAITAGLFLSEFVQNEYKNKWLHLDIAGPAFIEKEWDVNPPGASGVGLRTVLTWMRNISAEKVK
jgi:leucyl aminopeptidase